MRSGKHISSLQNPLVRQIVQLKEKKRGRDKTGLFVLEGQRELQLALKVGYEITKVLFCTDIISVEELTALFPDEYQDIESIALSKDVDRRVAYREKTEGMLALAKAKSHRLQDLEFHRKNPLILIAQAPEKPGNLGALLRTADAAHLDAVILADPKSDLYNPNIIRSSVGCLFTVNIGIGSSDEVLQYLKEKGIALYSAALSASRDPVPGAGSDSRPSGVGINDDQPHLALERPGKVDVDAIHGTLRLIPCVQGRPRRILAVLRAAVATLRQHVDLLVEPGPEEMHARELLHTARTRVRLVQLVEHARAILLRNDDALSVDDAVALRLQRVPHVPKATPDRWRLCWPSLLDVAPNSGQLGVLESLSGQVARLDAQRLRSRFQGTDDTGVHLRHLALEI